MLALAVFAPLALYALTMPTGVVGEDDGLFIINGVFLGVEHPPGYPVFTVVHYLFQQVPFGSAVVKGHLLSAVFGSLTTGVVYLVCRRLGVIPGVALLGAWVLAVCDSFWSQAVITEVYTLNALLFFGVTLCLVELWRDPHRKWPWLLGPALYGLGLANNWPLMALSAPALAVGLWPLRRHVMRNAPVGLGLLVVFAGVPYAWLYAYSRAAPAFSFIEPFRGLGDLAAYIGRRNYSQVDVQSSWGWEDMAGYAGWLAQDVAYQTAFLGALIVVVGFVWVIVRRRALVVTDAERATWWFAVFGVAAFVCNGLLLLVPLRNEYDDHGIQVFQAYPLVAYGVVAVGFALGLDFLARRWDSGWFRRVGGPFGRPGAGAVVAFCLGLALVGASLGMSWDVGERRGDDFSERYADFVFESVGEGATLMVAGDLATHALGYRHFVVGDRPDVRLVNIDGLVYSTNFLRNSFHHPPDLTTAVMNHYVGNVDRDVYWAYGSAFPELGNLTLTWGGPTALVTAVAGGSSEPSYQLTDVALRYGDWLLGTRPEDGADRSNRNRLLYAHCSYVSSIVHFGHAEDAGLLSDFVERAEDDPYCLNGMVFPVLERLAGDLYERSITNRTTGSHSLTDDVDLVVVEGWLHRAGDLMESGEFDHYTSFEAELLNGMGKLRILQGRPEEAQEYFLRSAALYGDDLNFGLMAASW